MEHTSTKAGSMERLESKQKMNSVVQEAGQEDGIVDQSPFTAAQMLASLPRLILNELFDHLDLRQATRLTRVSSSWAEEMKQIPKRNNGIALLKNWKTVKLAHLTAGGVAVPKSVPVSHLILVGKVFEQYERVKIFLRMLPSVRKITVDDEGFGSVYVAGSVVESLSSSFVEVIKVREWKLDVVVNFDLAGATEHFRRFFSRVALASTKVGFFSFSIYCPCLESRMNSLTDDWRVNKYRIWRLLDSHMWPYPQEQLEWLLASLGNLNGEMLETVKFLDAKWVSGGRYDMDIAKSRAALDKRNVTSKATSDGRRFNSLDLAFLGRLLVFLDEKVKIPGQKPPPFAFPHGLRLF